MGASGQQSALRDLLFACCAGLSHTFWCCWCCGCCCCCCCLPSFFFIVVLVSTVTTIQHILHPVVSKHLLDKCFQCVSICLSSQIIGQFFEVASMSFSQTLCGWSTSASRWLAWTQAHPGDSLNPSSFSSADFPDTAVCLTALVRSGFRRASPPCGTAPRPPSCSSPTRPSSSPCRGWGSWWCYLISRVGDMNSD